jgi:hypothetical protein
MELTREQLYEKLWTDGVGKTEKALGLKRPELKKNCDNFQIPRPSSGYWTALNLGKSPEKTPLPAMDDSQCIHTEDYIKPKHVKKEKPVLKPEPPQKTPEGKYVPRELPPDEPETIYTVPDKFLAMDPILMDTKQKLRERNERDNNWSKKNPYKSTPKKWLDITVSEGLEERALRIFATIWRAAETKDYHLKINANKDSYYPSCSTYFVVRGYEIRVELREINKRVKDESNTYWSSTKLVGNGRLKFICDRGYSRLSSERERVAAQDTEHTQLEDKIEHIMDVLSEIADEKEQFEKMRREAEERRKKEEELERLEEERKRKEAEEQARIEARREEERNKVAELLFESERARIAAQIREYASQYEVAMANRMSPEELQEKLQWMREKADFIDPFINREDDLLTPKDIDRLLNPEITKTTEESRQTSYGHESTYSYWQLKNAWWRR